MKKTTATRACLFGGALLSAGVANAGIINGSFETGDFTGWTTIDTQSYSFQALQVRPAGSTAYLSTFGSTTFDAGFPVTDGNYSATHGFDGGGGTISISQDALIDGTQLVFDWDAAIYAFDSKIDREFNVNIRAAGGGAVLQSTNIWTAGASAYTLYDSNLVIGQVVDVSAFYGTTVNVEFQWIVPESGAGPAAAALDNVRLEGTAAVPIPGTAFLLLSGLGLMVGRRRSGQAADT